MTNHFHIGIFNFLLQGGLILFSLVSYFLFVYFPYLFIKAALKPMSFDPKKRTALLSVLPGLFAWTVVFLTTGHAYPQFYIGLGFGIGAYLQIKKYGLTL
jgi:ABC-type Na+ efflux pump permease subunit